MALLNREALLKKDQSLEIARVDFDNDDHTFVREMSSHEKDWFEQSIIKVSHSRNGGIEYEQALEDYRAKLAVCTVCDEEGNLIFKKNDVQILSKNLPASKMEKIINMARDINAISDEDQENLVKNSVSGQGAGSSSRSAAN